MEYMPLVWLGIIILAVIVEASTCALVSIWFWIQIVVFVACSALLILFMKGIFKKTLGLKAVATNADALIGEEAVVTEAINNLESQGQVKVRGQIWSARAFDKDTKYEKGEILNVVAIEGVKLICKK